jgi:hypothetical protein
MGLQLYTCLMDCEGGTYISQHFSQDQLGAANVWANNPHPDMLRSVGFDNYFNEWSLETQAEIAKFGLVALQGLESAWCGSFEVQGKSFLLNVIETTRSGTFGYVQN